MAELSDTLSQFKECIMLSNRVKNIEESATLASAQKARELIAEGIDVIQLTLGEPDFLTPLAVKEAAVASIYAGQSDHYTNATGILPLKQAIVDFHKRKDNVIYTANQVVVGTGGKHILYALFQSIINTDDEVIIPAPYWVSYSEQVKLADGKCVFVETTQFSDYKVTVEQLDQVVTTRTKALVINSPNNPTGSVYTRKELQKIGEWAIQHNVLIIADEMYYRLVYGNVESVCFASLSKAIQDQCVIVNGLAKSFAMTGWRMGYALSTRQDIIHAMGQLISHETSNLTAVTQYAALAAFTGDQQVVEDMRVVFEERLNRFYTLIADIPGFTLNKPQGAFYLFPNVKQAAEATGYKTVENFVEALLTQAHVAVVAGKAFGANDCIRMSYAGSIEQLEEAARRIKQFVVANSKQYENK